MKRKLMLAASLLALACSAHAGDGMRFGVEADYPPFEYQLPSGELAGFDIDLGNAVCAKLQVKCTWVQNSFDSLIPALTARKFDVINSGMFMNEQRAKVVDFTSVVYNPPIGLIVRADSHIQGAESMNGKRIGVLQGGTQETYVKVHLKGATVVDYPSQSQVFEDLTAGRIDATILSRPNAENGFLKKPEGKGFEFVSLPNDEKINGKGVAFALRKNDQVLTARIDQAIAELKKDGTFNAIAHRYFSYPILAP